MTVVLTLDWLVPAPAVPWTLCQHINLYLRWELVIKIWKGSSSEEQEIMTTGPLVFWMISRADGGANQKEKRSPYMIQWYMNPDKHACAQTEDSHVRATQTELHHHNVLQSDYNLASIAQCVSSIVPECFCVCVCVFVSIGRLLSVLWNLRGKTERPNRQTQTISQLIRSGPELPWTTASVFMLTVYLHLSVLLTFTCKLCFLCAFIQNWYSISVL